MTRTRQQALKDALPAIEAFANGKEIRHVDYGEVLHPEYGWGRIDEEGDDSQWAQFHDPRYRWEIKPEPQYKPFPLEKLWEMAQCRQVLVRKSDGVQCFIDQIDDAGSLFIMLATGKSRWIGRETLLETHTLPDGTPCGELVK